MRVIVEIYRVLILVFLGGLIIGGSALIFSVGRSPGMANGLSALVIAGVLASGILLILSLGLTATFISMHDRLETLAEAASTLVALERERSRMSHADEMKS